MSRLRRHDPGLLSLRHAATTTLAAVLAMLAMRQLLPLAGAAAAPALIAAPMAAALSTSFTFALDDAGRRRAMRLCALAGVVAPWPVAVLSDIGSLPIWGVQAWVVAVVFAAFYIRRFGPVFIGVGLFGFTLTFFASVAQVSLAGAPWASLGAGLGVALAWIARFHVAPPDPARAFTDAIDRLRDDVCGALVDLCARIRDPDPAGLAQVGARCRSMRALLTRSRPLLEARGEAARARLASIAALAYDLELAIEVAAESLGSLRDDGLRLSPAVSAPLEAGLAAAATRIAGGPASPTSSPSAVSPPDVAAIAALGPPEQAQHALRLAIAVMRIGMAVDGLARLGEIDT